MKTHPADDKVQAAMMFYGDLAMQSETVIDTDAGFVNDEGQPIFKDMGKVQAMSMHMMHEHMKQTLEANNIDAQEVMQFFEMCLIAKKISGEDYHPEHLRVHHITRKENDSQIAKRRQTHLWECVQECIMAVQPDVLHVSDDGQGFAIDITNAHPLLTMYVQSMHRYETDQFIHGEGSMKSDEVKDYLNNKTAEINADAPKHDIDPDSDENDDDPFGMWV